MRAGGAILPRPAEEDRAVLEQIRQVGPQCIRNGWKLKLTHKITDLINHFAERRRAPRSAAQRHDESRLAARAVEFACMGLVALMFGMTVFGTVQQALAQPIAQVTVALDGR